MSDEKDLPRPLDLVGGSAGDRAARAAKQDAWDAAHPSKDLTAQDPHSDNVQRPAPAPAAPVVPAEVPAATPEAPAPAAPEAPAAA